MPKYLVAATTIALTATGCATDHKPKERAVSPEIVVASSMCTAYGTQAATKDPVGDRMICAFEERVGSHMLQCVCHDEQQLTAHQESAQQSLRDPEQARCDSKSGGACSAK